MDILDILLEDDDAGVAAAKKEAAETDAGDDLEVLLEEFKSEDVAVSKAALQAMLKLMK